MDSLSNQFSPISKEPYFCDVPRLSYGEVLVDKRAMYIRVTLY